MTTPSGSVRRYWVEAGTILYHEKQPDKPFIPRLGHSLPSFQVMNADKPAKEPTP